MTSLNDVTTRLRAALTHLHPDQLHHITTHLTHDLQPHLTQLTADTTNPDLTTTPDLLTQALTHLHNATTHQQHTTTLTHNYIAQHQEAHPSNILSSDDQNVPLVVPESSGRWKGRTATEHAYSRGEKIGRKAAGSKKYPVREVRTAEEIADIFETLSAGGTRQDIPDYKGTMVKLPDGTYIGYQVRSRSSQDPIIDINTNQEPMLKIHVNGTGWTQ